MLEHASEDHRVALQTIEVAKKRTKAQYDQKVHPHTFHKVDLVLVYEQAHDDLGAWEVRINMARTLHHS